MGGGSGREREGGNLEENLFLRLREILFRRAWKRRIERMREKEGRRRRREVDGRRERLLYLRGKVD